MIGISSSNIRAKLTSLKAWEIPKQHSSIAPEHVWSNPDQDPVPFEKRTWTGASFVTYWFSDLITIASWSTCSSIITTGLSATDGVLIILVAAFCNAIPTVLNGAIGADLHIPFPIAVRASYGYWLSYFCIVSRGILALFWFGIQTASGGACVTTVITAIWPSYANLPNHLPTSASITTQGMISYLIYNLIQFPCMLIPTHKLKILFLIKTICVVPVALGTVIWIAAKGSNSGAFFTQPPTVHGSERAWLWLSTLTSVTGGFSTIACNIPDFSRFARKPGSQVWQLPFIPFFKIVIGLFGIIAASASKEIYGEVLWSPTTIMAKWDGSSGGRAAMFFCGSAWLLAQVCVNISANSISFANDITTLAPKYFNIRRGVTLAAIVGGWAMCPWIIVSSAETFLDFMSAYAIFMAPIAGMLTADYWLVKKRKYDVPALYNPRGIYFYKYGINWRALVTTLVTIGPLLPGLANKVTPGNVSIDAGLRHLFTFNWLYGFALSVTLYTVLNLLWPDKQTLIPCSIHGTPLVLDGVEPDTESQDTADQSNLNEKAKGSHTAHEISDRVTLE